MNLTSTLMLYFLYVCIEDIIIEITNENFSSILDSFSHIFLLCYYPWDPVVDDFYQDLVRTHRKFLQFPHFTVAKASYEATKKVTDHYNVQFSPTLIFIKYEYISKMQGKSLNVVFYSNTFFFYFYNLGMVN